MSPHLPPEAWRSEAFAEDLFDDSPALLASQQRWPVPAGLLSLLPLVLAGVGAMAALWVGA